MQKQTVEQAARAYTAPFDPYLTNTNALEEAFEAGAAWQAQQDALPDLIKALQALVERDDNGGMHDTWEMGRGGEPEMIQSPALARLLDAARAALEKAL